jgi:ribosome recycling factor
MDENLIKQKMQVAVDLVASDIGTIRTGRATPSLVEEIRIPAYGGTQNLKLQELATITASDPQTIVIDPWDKSIIGDIKKGILAANIGLNPAIDGQIMRISLPPLTTEDRQKFVKLLAAKVENGKIMLRQVRGDAMKLLKKRFEEKEISEDSKFRDEKALQELTDSFTEQIEALEEKKKQELLII